MPMARHEMIRRAPMEMLMPRVILIRRLGFGVGVVGEAMGMVVLSFAMDVLGWGTLAEVVFIGSELGVGSAAELCVVADGVTPSNVDPGGSAAMDVGVVVSTAGRVGVVCSGIGVLSAIPDAIIVIGFTSAVTTSTGGPLRNVNASQ